MENYSNLFEELCSFRNLSVAFSKARKNKRFRDDVSTFELNLEEELLKLKQELKTQSYRPKPLRKFVIRDSKSRVIHASNFRDRVVHHALCNIIQSSLEKTFIYDSFANQKNKGTHKALARFDEFKRKISKNGKLIDNMKYSNQIIGFALKCDIKHYFQEIDHAILMKIIESKIDDSKIMWLIKKILNNSTNSDVKGMPLGNLTSQFFANVYLNYLDYFIKHKLKVRFYIRYVDDFVILHQSRQFLEFCRNKIDEFLRETLKIELHKDKTKIFPLYHGTPFLGFRIYYHHKLLKKNGVKDFIDRIDKFRQNTTISKEKIAESINGWMAYAKWGDTHKLIKRIETRVNKIYV